MTERDLKHLETPVAILGKMHEQIIRLDMWNSGEVRQRLFKLHDQLLIALLPQEPECTACGYIKCRCSIPETYGEPSRA